MIGCMKERYNILILNLIKDKFECFNMWKKTSQNFSAQHCMHAHYIIQRKCLNAPGGHFWLFWTKWPGLQMNSCRPMKSLVTKPNHMSHHLFQGDVGVCVCVWFQINAVRRIWGWIYSFNIVAQKHWEVAVILPKDDILLATGFPVSCDKLALWRPQV